MSSGSWTNNDGLYLQFGTTKATAETGGDYTMWGPYRVAEVDLNLGLLTSSSLAATTPTVISNTLFFSEGQGIQIDKVELENETITTPTTAAISIGLVQGGRASSDVPSTGGATSFVNGYSLTTAGFTTAGALVTFTAGTASGGSLIGVYNTQWNTNTSGTDSVGGYITANLGAATSATGLVRCRIYYHGVGTIQY